MKVLIDKSFEKDTNKLSNQKLLYRVATCIEQIINCMSVSEIEHLKKLRGFNNHFRIRIGDYRIGLRIIDDTAFLERMLHRKDIYKHYP